MTSTQIVSFVLSGVSSLVGFTIYVAVIVLAVRRWHRMYALVTPALLYAAAIVGATVPLSALFVSRFDASAFGLPVDPEVAFIARITLALTQLFAWPVALVHTALTIAVAATLAGHAPAFPLLLGGREPFRGWRLAAAIGAAAGVVSCVVFAVLHVHLGVELKNILRSMPGVDWKSPSVVLFAALPSACAAAASEELAYRGVLQPLLCGGPTASRFRVGLAVTATSLAWAFGHSFNTDQPALKLTQIFLLGLAFGPLARKYGIEASMIAHGVLNIVAVAAGVLAT